jgi:hypothetical protein
MRKLVVWILVGGIGTLLFGLGALRLTAVQDGIAQRVVARRLSEQHEALFEPDALRALICGSSSSFPPTAIDRMSARARYRTASLTPWSVNHWLRGVGSSAGRSPQS